MMDAAVKKLCRITVAGARRLAAPFVKSRSGGDQKARAHHRSVTLHHFLHSLVRGCKGNRSAVDSVHKGIECAPLLLSIHCLQKALGVKSTEVNHTNSASNLLCQLFGKKIEPLTALFCTLQRRSSRHLGDQLHCALALNCPVETPIRNELLQQICVVQLRAHNFAVNEGCEHSPISRPSLLIALSQLLSKLEGCMSRSVCRSGNEPHRSSTCSCHDHRSPVGHVPPFDCERAYRHRSSSMSTLDWILPCNTQHEYSARLVEVPTESREVAK